MSSCAGTYVSGDAGSNQCPAGYFRIEAEDACRTAATLTGMTFDFVLTRSDEPRGCFYDTSDNYAYFNTHAVGAGYPGYQPLCVTAGAPLLAARGTHRGTQRVLE